MFKHKYRLAAWPWRSLARLVGQLRATGFDFAVSAHGRGDPRDHLLLKLSGARRRVGFPRLGSGFLLSDPLALPDPAAHRYESWRTVGKFLGLELPPEGEVQISPWQRGRVVLIHSGAAQPVRVWPLERFQNLARRLRDRGCEVRVICNPEARTSWLQAGEREVATPSSIRELLDLMRDAGAFIGNDSGPGHLAAGLGIPTVTIFGPQVPEWFAPLHPAAVWVAGKPCPYKPCFDYCRFSAPHCLLGVTEEEVWSAVQGLLERLPPSLAPGTIR